MYDKIDEQFASDRAGQNLLKLDQSILQWKKKYRQKREDDEEAQTKVKNPRFGVGPGPGHKRFPLIFSFTTYE